MEARTLSTLKLATGMVLDQDVRNKRECCWLQKVRRS
jgi:hypothetical protein